MRRLAPVLIVLLLAGCGSSGTTATKARAKPSTEAPTASPDIVENSPSTDASPPPPEGAKQFAIGDTATITNDGEDSGDITVTGPKVSRRAVEQYGQAPKNGYYVTFTVLAQAKPTRTFMVNPFDFYVLEPDGTHIDGTSGNIATVGQNLSLVTLNGGEKVKGTLTLDVPAPHGQLVYAPGLSALGQWSF